MDIEKITTQWKSRAESFFRAERGFLGIHQMRVKDAANRVFNFIQLFHRVPVKRNVEAQLKKSFSSLLKTVAQLFNVAHGGFELRVSDFARALFFDNFCFDSTKLLSQFVENLGAVLR